MVTEAAGLPFNSLSRVAVTPSNQSIWKLFSPASVPHAWLSMVFEAEFEVLQSQPWQAYPAFDPPENFAPAALAEGLYYTSGLENAASAMEVAAIWGRNSALLAAQHLRERALSRVQGPGGAAADQGIAES